MPNNLALFSWVCPCQRLDIQKKSTFNWQRLPFCTQPFWEILDFCPFFAGKILDFWRIPQVQQSNSAWHEISEWLTKVNGTGSEIPPGGVISWCHSFTKISSSKLDQFLPKVHEGFKEKKIPKMKQQTKKRKGSGSKTCPFFMMEVVGWKLKASSRFLSQPPETHRPHPPAQQHG